MTNTQLFLSIGIPTLAIILASLRNDQEFNALRDEFKSLRGDFRGLRNEFQALRNEFSILRSDLRADIRILTDQTYTHGREIEALRKQQS
jgi:hypothetical protein